MAEQRLVDDQPDLGGPMGPPAERLDGCGPCSAGRQRPSSSALDVVQLVQLHVMKGERGQLGHRGLAPAGIGAHAGGEGDSAERPAQRRHIVQLAIEGRRLVVVAPGGDEPAAVHGHQPVQQRERWPGGRCRQP